MSQYPNQGGNYPPRPNQPPPPQYQGQPGGYPPQPPQYQGQPGGYPPPQQYQGQPYGYSAAPVKPPPNPYLYLIPIVGIILMAVGVFLPWFTISFLGVSLSVDGLGKASGTGEVVTAYNQAAGTGNAKDGVYLLGAGGLLLVLCLLGLFLKARGFAIAAIVFGVLCVGLTAYDVVDINRSLSGTSSGGASGTVGIGLYISLVGAIVILIGAIITVAFFRKKRA